jgi:hypothetical protein
MIFWIPCHQKLKEEIFIILERKSSQEFNTFQCKVLQLCKGFIKEFQIFLKPLEPDF